MVIFICPSNFHTIHKANFLKQLLKENSHFKLTIQTMATKMIEKVFKDGNIKIAIYRYGKLQEIETRKGDHHYILTK